MPFIRLIICLAFCCTALPSRASLPAEVLTALARAGMGPEDISVVVLDVDGNIDTPRLAHRAQVAMKPASVMKLTTTYAALDLLGPAYTWSTPVYVDGTVQDGTLHGTLYIKGQGDPKLVLERLWLLLRRVQGLGIRHINGSIVLDRSAWKLPDAAPGRFDGEPLRSYNATPDALLVNYKALLMRFTPHPASNSAHIQFEPPLYGVHLQTSVPLNAATSCSDYRSALQADFSDPARIRFAHSYPLVCGEKVWHVAYADHDSYAPRAVQGLWLEMGGTLSGSVVYGTLPAALADTPPTLQAHSPPLAVVVRDINKYSNNVMAQQVFLTLGQVLPLGTVGGSNASGAVGADITVSAVSAGNAGNAGSADTPNSDLPPPVNSFAASRKLLQAWWISRFGSQQLPVWENGSGLSHQERISAQALATMLQAAYHSATMSELMASLPIVGVDGTLSRSKLQSGSAHLKSGNLDDVLSRAGYVDATNGKRYVLVAFINHPRVDSEAARGVLDGVLGWVVGM
ncbi:MAG: D-alanyl-D-alanine carboxypeptidase [Rhodoferax sp.]|nr:D-alanyl-D-alanine carboxypeptidase [Rhodoferax sp.]